MTSMQIASITIGERRREDMGDLATLAASIRKHGLLHPIVVDADGALVAGERRLRAVESLGEKWIEVKQLDQLTEDERREIELDENIRRKDLTPPELSREMVRQATRVAQALSTQSVETPKIGRPSTFGVPKADIAEVLDVSPMALVKAEQHVAAVEKYPALESLPQATAIQTAKELDMVPEPVRELLLGDLQRLGRMPEMPKKPAEEKAYDTIYTLISLLKLDPVAVAEAAYNRDSAQRLLDFLPQATTWVQQFVDALEREASGPVRLVR